MGRMGVPDADKHYLTVGGLVGKGGLITLGVVVGGAAGYVGVGCRCGLKSGALPGAHCRWV